ncbi:MAG: hypothetical protein OEZ01_11920, partial [Candidatus Heimdallarchaeota archaeon]|nr:hypothetical protein [Candidatus Heimdallarchaeota archaeon]
MESKSQFESIWQVTFIIVFFSIISVNFWIPLTHIKDFNKLEYRQLSPLPTYESPKSIISYSKNFENYFNDHFSIRYRFIILNRKILVQIFDQKFLADVIRGKDNWLFWGWGSYKIKCQNASLLSQSELQEHLYVISNIHEELESQNIQLFFLIQPETCTIYPEYSEDVLPILGKQSMTDQYINYFQKNNPKIQFIDLRPDLIAAKDRYQL